MHRLHDLIVDNDLKESDLFLGFEHEIRPVHTPVLRRPRGIFHHSNPLPPLPKDFGKDLEENEDLVPQAGRLMPATVTQNEISAQRHQPKENLLPARKPKPPPPGNHSFLAPTQFSS